MKQFESSFTRTITWNKYHPKSKTLLQNRYLNYLIDPSIQGVNRLFLPLENGTDTEVRAKYYLTTEKIKDHNFTIHWRNLSDQPIKNDFKTYNIRNFVTGQGDDYTTECLLDHNYFKEH